MTTFAYSKSIRRAVAAALVLAGVAAAVGGLATAAHARPMLEIAPGGRHLQTSEGEPFFYLGDTAWALFHRLTREEAEIYLRDRADKGFTVIQAVALAEPREPALRRTRRRLSCLPLSSHFSIPHQCSDM